MNERKDGNFYASQGPLFNAISFENGVISADFTPCVAAVLTMCRNRGMSEIVEDNEGPGSGGREVTHLEFDLSAYKKQYVRIQLRDANGKMARSNPYYID